MADFEYPIVLLTIIRI